MLIRNIVYKVYYDKQLVCTKSECFPRCHLFHNKIDCHKKYCNDLNCQWFHKIRGDCIVNYNYTLGNGVYSKDCVANSVSSIRSCNKYHKDDCLNYYLYGKCTDWNICQYKHDKINMESMKKHLPTKSSIKRIKWENAENAEKESRRQFMLQKSGFV